MGVISTSTLLLAGVAMAAAGTVAAGVAAKERSDFEATDQRQRADRELEIAAMKEEDFRRDESRRAATSRANQGRSGVQDSTGSPLLVTGDFEMEKELQALRIRAGGAVNSSRLRDQATLTKAAGKNERTQGFARAGSTLLTGLSEFNS